MAALKMDVKKKITAVKINLFYLLYWKKLYKRQCNCPWEILFPIFFRHHHENHSKKLLNSKIVKITHVRRHANEHF